MIEKDIKDVTDEELKKEYYSTIQIIEDTGCCGKSDLKYGYALETEMNKRGLEVKKVYKKL